jgi:uncharacterized protein YbbC (DUF1343 family)
MLKEVDVLVYDIQDIGSRYYTYISTLGECMQAAAERKIPFIVLDRPNPLGGNTIEGPLLDPTFRSFVGAYAIPVRYGLTPGELAGWIKSNLKLDLELSIVRMKHWARDQWYEETNLIWVPPSPNIPTMASRWSIRECASSKARTSQKPWNNDTIESRRSAVGRWHQAGRAAECVGSSCALFRPVSFTPRSPSFHGETCQGVQACR